MADLSKIKLNGTTYNFKDAEARNLIENFEETDPTVPAWAKASKKPTYTASEVGAVPKDVITGGGGSSGTINNNAGSITLYEDSMSGNASLTMSGPNVTLKAAKDLNNSSIILKTNSINNITLSEGATTIIGVVTPTADTMAANKKYVDDAVSGITIPTTVSSFTNDSGYQTSTQVQSAINTAIGDINSFEVEVVSTLPASNIKDHTIYFVPQASNSSAHDEYMYINNAWELIGTTTVDLSNYLQTTDIAAWAKAANKPTYTAMEVGALPNTYTAPVTSVNGQTGAVSLSIPTVPTNVSDFTNDAGYLTSYTETDPTVPAWAKAASKPSYTAAEVGAMATTHAANAITSTDISNWNNKSNFSGSYNDLTNKPTIPAATTVTQTLTSGTAIGSVNSTTLYAPTPYNDTALAARVTALENIPWVTYYSGTSTPNSAQGNNGDIYLQTQA